MRTGLLFSIVAAGAIAAGQAGAQDAAAGETLFQKTCKNCHGPKAQGMASYPKLSDKETDYVVMRLEQYRAGEKIGPNSMLMIPHAAKLSDEERSIQKRASMVSNL